MNEPRAAWRARFASARIGVVRVGPADPGRGVLAVRRRSTFELVGWDVGSGTTSPLGIDTDGFDHSWWIGATGRTVLHLVDGGGDEQGHVYRTSVDDPTDRRDMTPDWPAYAIRSGAASADGRSHALAVIGDDGFALAILDDSGVTQPRVLYRSDHQAWKPCIAADGRLACVDTTDHALGMRRFAVSAFEVATGHQIGRMVSPGGGTATATRFSPLAGDSRILVTEYAAPHRHARPVLWDPATDSRHVVTVHCGPTVDLLALDWSRDGRYLLLGQADKATQSLLVHDLHTGRTTPIPLPAGSYWHGARRTAMFGPDDAVLACRETMGTPSAVWRWSPRLGAGQIFGATATPRGHEARSVTFPSSDGTEIQAWLLVPPEPGPHPAVVNVHGGPHVAIGDDYNPVAQSWADHGFAYLDVNYRGSIGRGREFAEKVWGDVGHWEPEDLAAAHQWLVEHDIADPQRIVLTGESYGGYLTLYCLARQPHLWAAGVAGLGIGDWALAYRDAAPAMRAAFRTFFGGTPEQVPGLYRDRSPITHADRITAAVLVWQGRRDSRTPPAQMDAFVARLRELGKHVEIDWFDAGHGYGGSDEEADQHHRAVTFVRQALAKRGPLAP